MAAMRSKLFPLFLVLNRFLQSVAWLSVPSLLHRRSKRSSLVRFMMVENGKSSTDGVKILGVGGGIGSGKSTACQWLVSELGCVAHIGAFRGRIPRLLATPLTLCIMLEQTPTQSHMVSIAPKVRQ